MGIDHTVDRVEPGDRIKVHGKRTETTGVYKGVGLTEDGEARILIEVKNMPIMFAYDFDEVRMIERLEPAVHLAERASKEDQVDSVEDSYDEEVLNANAGGHSGSGVKARFGD